MSTDPVSAPPDAESAPVRRPVVARPTGNRAVWIFGAVLAVVAVMLFSSLEAHRIAGERSAITAPTDSAGSTIASPPPLALPRDIPAAGEVMDVPAAPVVPALATPVYPPPPGPPRVVESRSYRERSATYPVPSYVTPTIPQAPSVAAPVPDAAPTQATQNGDGLAGGRVGASRLLHPAQTVPQGVVIPAVMETALDSNRPGFARAIVSRDVRGFDGSSVLIPRGSRLFGEYKADLTDGQNRAFVMWQKLTRPDGVQIALESPAADTLGRAGVKGSVDTHFFSRFGGAILQSLLDVGVAAASRRASNNNTVILGVNGGGTSQQIQPNPQAVKPTLKVRQGSRVSVFVARDLDFSTVQ